MQRQVSYLLKINLKTSRKIFFGVKTQNKSFRTFLDDLGVQKKYIIPTARHDGGRWQYVVALLLWDLDNLL